MTPKSFHLLEVILMLCPFLVMRSFSNFARFLSPMSEYFCREWPFIVMFREIMLNRVSFVLTDQWAFHTTQWKAIPDIILRTSVTHVERHSNMTVFPEMGIESKLPNQLESFRYHTLLRKILYTMTYTHWQLSARNVLHIHRSVFLWDTRYNRKPTMGLGTFWSYIYFSTY